MPPTTLTAGCGGGPAAKIGDLSTGTYVARGDGHGPGQFPAQAEVLMAALDEEYEALTADLVVAKTLDD